MSSKPTPLMWGVLVTHKWLPSSDRDSQFGFVSGLTPRPTVEDGWYVECSIVPTEDGLTIRSMEIRPSEDVWVDGVNRKRTKAEFDIDINSSVLKLVNFREIREAFRREVDYQVHYAATTGLPWQEEWEQVAVTASKEVRTRTVNTPANLYVFAQDVLEEAGKGKGMRQRLSDRWFVQTETVKSRLRLLREKGWIAGGGTRASYGPTYIQYEQSAARSSTEEVS